ncbi:MAG: DUF1800 domain-containing protein [Bacteroidota bacterium]
MDRRAFLSLGQRVQTAAAPATSTFSSTTLAPYAGEWTTAQAAHLLRRTIFGPTPTQIKRAVSEGLGVTIGQLFADQPLPAPPVYYDYENDPNVPLGETWISSLAPNPLPPGLFGARRRSLLSWQLGLMMQGGASIREKMVLFWHNHFALEDNNGQRGYQYLNTLRTNALGNFRTLVEQITVDPSMLLYLNGHQNSRQAPNENYARELLELFTIGRGEAVGPGDYTNYTEDDVVQMARALTGWRAVFLDTGVPAGIFVPNRHDTEDKQLSHRFDTVVISDAGADEYKVVIGHILQKSETARYLARQLHIWFVGANIDPVIETNIIEPLAQIILDDDYEIQQALETLLSSDYFFDTSHRGCMVSHPLDFMFRIVTTMGVVPLEDVGPLTYYRYWNQLRRITESLDMSILGIPSVAGWRPFYQAPNFYELWINSVSLTIRQEVGDTLLGGINQGGVRWEPDLLSFVAEMDNNLDPNSLLEQIGLYLFSYPIAENQRNFLKEILIPGLPDFEWTVEYADYLQDPEDPDLRNAVLTKLEAVFSTLLKMPEFHLI